MKPTRVLFITWDGPQTQYLGRLFLPVFGQLKTEGFSITVLQFSTAGKEHREGIRAQCEEKKIAYIAFPVIKRWGVLGVLLSIIAGSIWLTFRLQRGDFDFVMPRSIVPALVLRLSSGKNRSALIYDSDGLPIEQRLEFEGMPENGFVHRFLLHIERNTLNRAVAVISRSQFGTSVLRSRMRQDSGAKLFLQHNNGVGPPMLTHPNKNVASASRHHDQPFTVAYVGSWGDQYEPTKMLTLVSEIRRVIPETRFAIFSGDVEAVNRDLTTLELIEAPWVSVREIRFTEVPAVLENCDLGLAFRKKSMTADSVYPLKLADYLFAGLPVVGNVVADMEPALLEKGVFFDSSGKEISQIVDWCVRHYQDHDRQIRKECVSLAHDLYRLETTTGTYRSALEYATPRLG